MRNLVLFTLIAIFYFVATVYYWWEYPMFMRITLTVTTVLFIIFLVTEWTEYIKYLMFKRKQKDTIKKLLDDTDLIEREFKQMMSDICKVGRGQKPSKQPPDNHMFN